MIVASSSYTAKLGRQLDTCIRHHSLDLSDLEQLSGILLEEEIGPTEHIIDTSEQEAPRAWS